MKKKSKKRMIAIIIVIAIILVAVVILMIQSQKSGESTYYQKLSTLKANETTNTQVNDQTAIQVTTAVQQIMIGTACDDYDTALQTLLTIKEAGYDAIELNQFMIHKASFMVKMMTQFAGMPIGNGDTLDWPKLVAESGIKVISLHSDLNSIENDPEAVAAEAKSFGTDIVVITGMYQFDYSDLEEVQTLAQRLNAAGKSLSEQGIRLLYHNHNCELQKVSLEQTAYDVIIEETNPEYINFEFDSYWMAEAGANVVSIMEKLGTRLVLWHINDRGCSDSGPYMTPILEQHGTELGYGNMDLDTLSEIAIRNGVEGVVLETHENWVDDDPIKSLQISAAYMQQTFN